MPFNYDAFRKLITLVGLPPRDLSEDIGTMVKGFGEPLSPNLIEALNNRSLHPTDIQID